MEHKVYLADCATDAEGNRCVPSSRVEGVQYTQKAMSRFTKAELASSPILQTVADKFKAANLELRPPVSPATSPSGTLPVIPEETEEEEEVEKEEEEVEKEEEEKEEEDKVKDDNDQGDDASDDESDFESSDDDDNDSTGVTLHSRKPQFQGGASAGSTASKSEEASSSSQSSDSTDAARMQQLREAQRLHRLEAGEDVSDDSVSVHTDFSSDDEISPPSTSATSPSDLQLMVIPQPSGLPPYLASVPEAIRFFHQDQASRAVLLAPSLTITISTWQTPLRKPPSCNFKGRR